MGNRTLLVMGMALLAVSVIGLGAQAASGTQGWWPGTPGHMFDGGHMGWDSAHDESSAEPIEGAAEVLVTASDFAFSPATLELEAGQPVNLTLFNDGSVPHDLVIADLGVHVAAAPGQQSTVGVLPVEAGTFEVVCTYPGHAGAGMTATLEVETDA